MYYVIFIINKALHVELLYLVYCPFNKLMTVDSSNDKALAIGHPIGLHGRQHRA